MEKSIVLDRTKTGRSYRTTVPETVKKLLQLDEGNVVEWVFDGSNILVRKLEGRGR